jgi:hypothetical protein
MIKLTIKKISMNIFMETITVEVQNEEPITVIEPITTSEIDVVNTLKNNWGIDVHKIPTGHTIEVIKLT